MSPEEWEGKRARIVECLQAIVDTIDDLEARVEATQRARAGAEARRRAKRRRLFGLLSL